MKKGYAWDINTRTGADAQAWLARHRRVRFVFTPKHGSWLNMAEIEISVLVRQCLDRRIELRVLRGQRAGGIKSERQERENSRDHPRISSTPGS